MPSTTATRKSSDRSGYGDEFNPRWAFDVLVVPRGLLARTELPGDAKLLYCRMASYATVSGKCWAKQKTLAEDIGCNLRSVTRHLATLEELGLIRGVQRGQGLTNVYTFLRHPWIEEAATDDPDDPDGQTRQNGVPAHAKMARPLPMSSGPSSGSTGVRSKAAARRGIHAEPDLLPDQEDEPQRPTRIPRRRAAVRTASAPAPAQDRRAERKAPNADTAKGLLGHFEALARDRFTRKQLAFGQFNQGATGKLCADILANGVDADTVRVMMKIYMTEPMVVGVPLWKGFAAARHRLADAAERYSKDQQDPVQRYAFKGPGPGSQYDFRRNPLR